MSYGQALIREGKPAEGIAPLKAGIAAWEASGGKVRSPTWKAFLAEAMALTGDLDDALHLLDEVIAQIERPGWEERFHYAEILRLKGWMLSLKGDLEGAERNFLASLDWARRQQAKMWELRTSTSLARLWQSQGKRQEAYELLAPVYDWFTEGFDTKDLQEAKVSARRTQVGAAGLAPVNWPEWPSPRSLMMGLLATRYVRNASKIMLKTDRKDVSGIVQLMLPAGRDPTSVMRQDHLLGELKQALLTGRWPPSLTTTRRRAAPPARAATTATARPATACWPAAVKSNSACRVTVQPASSRC